MKKCAANSSKNYETMRSKMTIRKKKSIAINTYAIIYMLIIADFIIPHHIVSRLSGATKLYNFLELPRLASSSGLSL